MSIKSEFAFPIMTSLIQSYCLQANCLKEASLWYCWSKVEVIPSEVFTTAIVIWLTSMTYLFHIYILLQIDSNCQYIISFTISWLGHERMKPCTKLLLDKSNTTEVTLWVRSANTSRAHVIILVFLLEFVILSLLLCVQCFVVSNVNSFNTMLKIWYSSFIAFCNCQ